VPKDSTSPCCDDLSFTTDGALVAVGGRTDPDKNTETRILDPSASMSVDDVLLWNTRTGLITSILPRDNSRTLSGFFYENVPQSFKFQPPTIFLMASALQTLAGNR
jgi:hypothetical protein